MGGNLTYPCKTNHRIEEDAVLKKDAKPGTTVECGENGTFLYPNSWPQCSTTVTCPDPGNSTEVTRTLASGQNFVYGSVLSYKCDDLRKWIRSVDSEVLSASLNNVCQWRQSYPLDGTNLECIMHHCRHPHDEPGSHPPPGAEYQIILKNEYSWDIAFGEYITYKCEDGTWIENNEIDPTEDFIEVECLTIGEYNTPVRQGETWPNCTETVVCGVPPDPPVNGSRTWLNGAEENQMTYDTGVLYHCEDGSQFDTDNDGLGDSVTVEIRCQWNKVWFPYLELPPCIITHCVEPFKIPDETNLEEITSDWTPINENKQYQCKNTVDSVYTMFWESDRSKSTFEIFCKDDGYFTWKEWPICLTDVICSPDPPEIPTHTEYTLIEDDGTVTINGLTYPTYPQENRISNDVWNSTMNNLLIAKNYMANLTYDCGSAREFFYDDGSQAKTQSMTCQWDRTWTPQVELGECNWVACLKPPPTPVSTHLKVTDWFGEPISFGEQIRYVCERGYQFEEDPSQIDVCFTCQDGSNEEHKDKRGFFDVPESEEGWPKCVLGILVNFSLILLKCFSFQPHCVPSRLTHLRREFWNICQFRSQ